MADPDNLVLEHLRAIRGEIGKLADAMRVMSIEMAAMRQHLESVVALQRRDGGEESRRDGAETMSGSAATRRTPSHH